MIKLTKKGDYALKCVLYVADRIPEQISISVIAEELLVSETFLRRIIGELVQGNILKSNRGRNGGIILSKEPKKISFLDIMRAVNEPLAVSECSAGLECDKKDTCQTTDVLINIQKSFDGILQIWTIDKML